ncbi:Sec-independent protein translocase subunit TatA/TatB [Tundrisphaera sp. TA3]|uniref:Sec-independent protein translocase subunit TatA/TatB n=1 Tax=Tundrisphaera sp. TA3 TaxID=3435775 RepID=UPI003EB7FBE2
MFPNLNPMEMMVVFGVAVLLFGKRLPEVGRTLGKGIVEFKKGIRGIEDEFRFDAPSYTAPVSTPTHTSSDVYESSVPKFEPPTSAPVRQPDVPNLTFPD